MNMNRDAAITVLREIIEKVEKAEDGDSLTVSLAWFADDGGLHYMSVGHPAMVDALIMHSIRVSAQVGVVSEDHGSAEGKAH